MSEQESFVPRDFGVYMSVPTLHHKMNDGRHVDGRFCFWKFGSGWPYGIGEGSRMWVAAMGQWRGYFVIHLCAPGEQVEFYSDSWKPVKDGGSRTQFRGFTYKVPRRSQ